MGRMLEVLKNRDANRPTLADTKEPTKLAGAEVVNEWSLRDDEVPFIEVGPNQAMAGSAHVMAVPAPVPPRREPPQQPSVQPPHPPTELAIVHSLLNANVLEPRPLTFNFEPYTGLGEVGKVANEIIAYHQPNDAISQQYLGLVDKLLQDEANKVLLLSGIRPGVGTSTVLLNLAVAAAQKAQKRVAVVETQRQRPSLAGKLGVKPLAFLQDVLSGAVSIEQALLKSPLPRLALLAASASHPEIVLAVEGLTWLLTWLKQRNDLVLVDGPSLDEQNDLSRLAPLSDAMFLVMPQGEPATQARGLLQSITRIGGRLRGLLHTQLAS
jgi:Mrp family chromosome partitioning ATPase